MVRVGRVTLRPAAWLDVVRLYQWRNDPLTRRWSLSPARVGVWEHLAWFLSAWWPWSSRRLFVAEYQGVPIGTARLDVSDRIVCSITVGCEYRGRGAGVRIVEALVHKADAIGPQPLVAAIRHGNIASVKSFERAGFVCVGSGENVMWYEYRYGPDRAS